jgi:hypothetical protein
MMLRTFLGSIKKSFLPSLSLPDRDDLSSVCLLKVLKNSELGATFVSDERFIVQTLTVVQFEKLIPEL